MRGEPQRREDIMGAKLWWRNFPWILVLILLFLLGVGLLFIRSASFSTKTGSYLPYARLQMIWILVGSTAFVVVLVVPARWIERFAYPAYVLSLLLLLSLFFIGKSSKGATRWIVFGPLRIQPSELMKLAIILALARYLRFRDDIRSLRGLLLPLGLVLLPMALILKQPDLGTAMIVVPVLFALLYCSGARLPHLGLMVSSGLTCIPVFWFFLLKPYQKDRIFAFLNPDSAPVGIGYQAIQSLIAVGSGGILGKGWGEGTQTQLNFLPERHTDFIFSVIAEEWGFLGALGVILLYLILVMYFLEVAHRIREPFWRLVVVGVTALFAAQAFTNMGMTVGLMPITGLTLPFLSYGGSSLLTSFLGLSLVVKGAMRKVPVLADDFD
jgi:rod shape determining protein RodA